MPDFVTINGGDGNDVLADTGVANRLNGNGGNDSLTANFDATTLTGGLGNDTLVATGQRDALNGDDGNDLITGPVPTNPPPGFSWTLFGGAGNDTVTGSGFVGGGDGDDVLAGQGLLTGDAGNDRLTGQGLLQGGEGADTLEGSTTGQATLQGGNGDDLMVWRHGEGLVTMEGGAGSDALTVNVGGFTTVLGLGQSGGGSGAPKHFGVDIDPNLFNQPAVDAIGVETVNVALQDTKAGHRQIIVDPLDGTEVRTVNLDLSRPASLNANYEVQVRGLAGNDQLSASVDASGGVHVTQVINGVLTTTNVSALRAGDAITLHGDDGNDTLSETGAGGAAPITLVGAAGDDVLIGGAGATTMIGNVGDDTLTGGGGNERFMWFRFDGSDRVDGGAGSDTENIQMEGGNNSVTVTAVGARAVASVNGSAAATMSGVETVELHVTGGSDDVQIGDLTATDVRNVVVDLAGSSGQSDGAADTVRVAGAGTADQITISGASGAPSSGATPVIADTAGGATVTTTITNFGAEDRVTVNAGAGDDLITSALSAPGARILTDGGAGQDTQAVVGGSGADLLIVSASGAVVTVDSFGVVAQDINVETLTLKPQDGADSIQVSDLGATAVKIVNIDLSGASGAPDGAADTVDLTHFAAAGELASVQINGSSETVTYTLNGVVTDTFNITGLDGLDKVLTAPATILGSAGDDVLNGSAGADSLNGSGGADTINAAGGSDSIQGGGGNDQINEIASATTVSAVVVDGGAGADTVSIAAPATPSTLTFGLGAVPGHFNLGVASGAGGLNADLFNVENAFVDASHLTSASINGSSGANFLVLLQSGSNVFVEGTTIPVVGLNGLAAGATLQVSTGDAADTIDATRMGAAGHTQVLNAGGGNDTLLVSQSTAFGGAGDDTFIWLRDAGADTLDGGAGNDTETISTGGSADTITFSANASGHVIESLNGKVQDVVRVETISIAAGDRADVINLGDTSHTDLRTINLDLTGTAHGPDGTVDVVNLAGPTGGAVLNIVHATGSQTAQAVYTLNGALVQTVNITGMDAIDQINVTGTPGADTLSGSGAGTVVSGGDGNDLIGVGNGAVGNGDAGADTVNGSGNLTVVNGGAGDDSLSGVGGSMTLNGGDGNDTILADMSAGRSLGVHFTVDGGAGADTLEAFFSQFGNGVSRTITIGTGGQAHFFSPVPPDGIDGSVNTVDATINLTGIEHLITAGGLGSDDITIADQTGSGVTGISVDLGANPNGPNGGLNDGIRDNVTLMGTNGADSIVVTNIGGPYDLEVTGLPAAVTLRDIDPWTSSVFTPSDDVSIRLGAGNDSVDLTGFIDQGAVLSLDLGSGVNTIQGGSAVFSYVFQFSALANDTINGFRGKAVGGHDTIDLGLWNGSGVHSLQGLIDRGLITQVTTPQGFDTIITDGHGDVLHLHNYFLSYLTDQDFLFGS